MKTLFSLMFAAIFVALVSGCGPSSPAPVVVDNSRQIMDGICRSNDFALLGIRRITHSWYSVSFKDNKTGIIYNADLMQGQLTGVMAANRNQ